MGAQLLRSFPWIDAVCTGEGDEVLPRFLTALRADEELPEVPGMLRRQDADSAIPVPRVERLDLLPYPDYGDYFDQAGRAFRGEAPAADLPLETSRGCWWGEKCHCVFCGDLPALLPYRSKTPSRVLSELHALTAAHPFVSVQCVDDAMDARYPETLFPMLAAEGPTLPFYFQVRPNLSRADLQAMRAGGVAWIQPGIESLSGAVLQTMRKGTSRIQNLQLLRWCGELGICVDWNFLYGFPDEDPAEYPRLAEELPLYSHLQPPQLGSTWITLKRFSPHWRNPGEFGLTNIRPWPSYHHVYPLGETALARLAFFFDCDYVDGRQPFEYSRPLRRAAGEWIAAWQGQVDNRPRLEVFRLRRDELLVIDTRTCAVGSSHRLGGLPARLLEFCDDGPTHARILRRCDGQAADTVDATLAALVEAKLMISDHGRFLSLPLLRNR